MHRFLRSLLVVGLASMASLGHAADDESFRLRVDNLKSGRFAKAQLATADMDPACAGGNQSPPVTWVNAPAEARSFVLVLTDKDVARKKNAPAHAEGIHWLVANIPASTHSLPEGIGADGSGLPDGALQTRTDAGKPGFVGICPPEERQNRYEFRVFALKVDKLEGVGADTPASEVLKLAQAQSLATARLIIIDHQGVGYRTGTKLQR